MKLLKQVIVRGNWEVAAHMVVIGLVRTSRTDTRERNPGNKKPSAKKQGREQTQLLRSGAR